ncbi:hypothetical protein HW44_03065 [Nitrosococcus oceani]|nr:hypothetical protein HW44_03065 [Nitrosococcus oceani]
MKKLTIRFTLVVACIFASSCATTNQRVLDSDSGQSALQKRSYQTRYFDSNDKEFVMRGLISTLQDLGFVLDDANMMLGTVSGTRFYKGAAYKATGSVRPSSARRTIMVRLNLQYGVKPIEDAVPYQDIFASLSKSLFLQANVE